MANKTGLFRRVFGDESISRVEKMRAYSSNAGAIDVVNRAIKEREEAVVREKFEALMPRVKELIDTWRAGEFSGFPLPRSAAFRPDMSEGMGVLAVTPDDFYLAVRPFGCDEILLTDGSTVLFGDMEMVDGMELGAMRKDVPAQYYEVFVRKFELFEEDFYSAIDATLRSQDAVMEEKENKAASLALVDDILSSAFGRYEQQGVGLGKELDDLEFV